MKLWSYWRSSASYRVRIGLAYKNVSYEYVPVHLIRDGGDQHKPDFVATNPMQQVPVLELEHEPGVTVRLTQSVAILEYIEERFPEPSLLPSCPYLRARVRACVEIVNSGIQPLQNLGIMDEIKRLGGDAVEFARAANVRGLSALEAQAQASETEYLVGDAPTLADVFLVPQLYGARRFGVDLGPYPRLVAIDGRLATIAAFAAAHPDKQPDAPVT